MCCWISIPSRSPYHGIIDAFNRRRYQLVVTTPVLLEYEEILTERANAAVARNILEAFTEAGNLIHTKIYYHWNLIAADPDDNKFTDAYLNGEAEYLVTNDVHFNVVKRIEFPLINIISANDFLDIAKGL